MKYILFIFLFTGTVNHSFANEIHINHLSSRMTILSKLSVSDTTLDYLLSLNLVSYQNHPVDSFLSILPSNFVRRKIVGGGRPRYADALLISYPNNITVHIIVRQFNHMNPRSNTLQWDINIFKLENLDHVEVHNGPNCVAGCQ
jgi:hypothetical protein